jgi:hypothetical protein
MAALELRNVDHRSRERYSEQLFELFVGKFGMDVDVIDAYPLLSSFLQWNFHYLTQPVLSHQSIELKSWPLQERFRIAMRLGRRPPPEFQRTVGLPISEIVQLSDVYLGTALHWAASGWCRQVDSWFDFDASSPPGYNDLEKFILTLMEDKTLLHAREKHGRTPLMCLLDYHWFHEEEDELWIPFFGAHEGCAIATERWGMLLGHAGVPLPQYVERENALLASRSSEVGIRLRSPKYGRAFDLNRFVISEQGSLQLEAIAITELSIWEFRPPPGLFLDSLEEHSTIFWTPDIEDGGRDRWQKTSSRKFRTNPFVWTVEHERQADEMETFMTLFFWNAHDDHSALALLASRDGRRRARESQRTRYRSSSMPPLRAYIHEDPFSFGLPCSPFSVPGLGEVPTYLHKCLFDAKWGFQAPNDDGEHSWRECMKGCRGRLDFTSFFGEFLTHTASQQKRMASEWERIGRIVEVD